MTSRSIKFLLKPLSIAVCSAAVLFAALPVIAQAPAATSLRPRITAPIDNSSRATLAGSRPPRANSADDIGAVSPSTKLQGISLVFSRSAAQQSALDALVAAQQNPASPLYHQWLTPEQFAGQFGVADADIAAVETWLEQQGFSVDSVSRSRNRIYFSGSAAQVDSAFGASLHNYRAPAIGNQPPATHFAPSADLTIPAALASSVLAVTNLSDFRPHARVKIHAPQAQPRFTSSQTGENFLTPADVDTIYNITGATGAGFNGAGQTIVVVGQSAIETSDLTNFQAAAGIPTKLPTIILMPGTGTSTINPGGSKEDDEVESDLDLEYSDAIAQGATIDFIYTGSNTTYGAFDAIDYAIENKSMYPASIISSSYGECEPELGSSEYSSLNAELEQAATQGQTVIAAAGDDGSTDCNGEYSSKEAADNEQLAVDFPGSSQYVTSMGGTEFPLADIVPGSPYFDAQGSSDLISSAKSYIPEQVWNDDAGDVSLGSTSPSPIASGGGGVSIYTPRPSWQTGVPGIPSGGNRLVPDLSLYASSGEPDVAADTFYGGYLFCSSDSAGTGVTGSCAHGFRDTNDDYLTVAGGTSFDAPIFSGMLAIINQAKGYTATSGQGVINPTLYTLAANATTYASDFHDITVSGNECDAGATYCGTGPQTTDYVTTTGYDEASGLGSVDLYNLLTSWPNSNGPSSLAATTTTLTAATDTPAAGAADTITITVAASATNTAAPTGTVSVTVDGIVVESALPLTAGVATYSFESSTTGSHTIAATYSGDTNFSPSTGTLTLNVGGTTSTTGTFTLAVTKVTVAPGASGTGTITITPANGYTGTVDLTVGGQTTLTDGCVVINPTSVAITGTAAGTASYTVYTSSTACTAAGAIQPGARKLTSLNPGSAPRLPKSPWKQLPIPATLAGTFLLVCFRRRSRLLRSKLLRSELLRSKLLRVGLALGLLLTLSFSGLGLTGCGGSSTSTPPPVSANTPAGTYVLTITGTDSRTASITNSTSLTVTVN